MTHILERLELSLFFLVPCSLLSLLVHERGALCEPGLLSCLVILLLCHRPRWDSNRGPAHVCTRVNIAAIIIAAPESDLADVTGRVDERESTQLETTKSRFQQLVSERVQCEDRSSA